MDLIQQNFKLDNGRFYMEQNPKIGTYEVKEDPDQKEKDEIVSKIEAVDSKLKQNLSERERRDVKNKI